MNPYGQKQAEPGEDFRVPDRVEIVDTVWRFALSLDIGDREMFEGCFTDPLLWDLSDNATPLSGTPADDGPVDVPRSEFVARAFDIRGSHAPSRDLFAQHCIHNPIVTFTGDATATVLAHVRIPSHTRRPGAADVEHQMVGGLYHLDAERSQGRWRLCAVRLAIYCSHR